MHRIDDWLVFLMNEDQRTKQIEIHFHHRNRVELQREKRRWEKKKKHLWNEIVELDELAEFDELCGNSKRIPVQYRCEGKSQKFPVKHLTTSATYSMLFSLSRPLLRRFSCVALVCDLGKGRMCVVFCSFTTNSMLSHRIVLVLRLIPRLTAWKLLSSPFTSSLSLDVERRHQIKECVIPVRSLCCVDISSSLPCWPCLDVMFVCARTLPPDVISSRLHAYEHAAFLILMSKNPWACQEEKWSLREWHWMVCVCVREAANTRSHNWLLDVKIKPASVYVTTIKLKIMLDWAFH